MNRLKKQKQNSAVSVLVPVVSFAFIFSIMLYGIIAVSDTGSRAGANAIRTAVNRYILHTYASEGQYPPSLEYIQDKYGLTYDSNKYIIDYQISDTSVMPVVTVTEVTE